MADVYDECVGGSLRLKSASGSGGVKKKKKKKNRAKEFLETVEKSEEKAGESSKGKPHRTPAEMAFKRVQDKRQAEKVIEKAKKTHKQRVEEFNSNLDKLSEHYDIPKVSWTK